MRFAMKLNIKFYDTVVGDMNETVLSYDEDGVTVACDGKMIKLAFEEDYGEFCYRIRKRSKTVLVHSKENFKWFVESELRTKDGINYADGLLERFIRACIYSKAKLELGG